MKEHESAADRRTGPLTLKIAHVFFEMEKG